MPAKWAVFVGVSGVGCALLTLAACTYPSVDSFEGMVGLPDRGASSSDANVEAGVKPRDDGGAPRTNTSETTGATVDASPPKEDSAPPPPPPLGRWFQANGQECGTFCATRNSTNVASEEGARCTSGENIPQSALTGGITYGQCFPNCNAHLVGANPRSENGNCYADGQKHDGDSSDVTRGCFCR